MFKHIYDWVLTLAKHPRSHYYLGGLSFAESSFFPIPPDVMLIPMSLAKPKQWFYLASITTIASVLGGILGYVIGAYAFEWLLPLIEDMGYQGKFEIIKQWMQTYGLWVIFAAGFSPIPYKLFTIAAGLLSMLFIPFVLASIVGRGARFYLVAKMEPTIIKYIEWIGWLIVALILSLITYLSLH